MTHSTPSIQWDCLDTFLQKRDRSASVHDKRSSCGSDLIFGPRGRLDTLEDRQLFAAAPSGVIESRAFSAFGVDRAVFEFDISPETLGIEAGGSVRLNFQVQDFNSEADPAYPRIRLADGDRAWLPAGQDVVMDDMGGDTDAFRSIELTEGKYRVHVIAEGRVVDPGSMNLLISLAGDADGDLDVDQADVDAVRLLATSGVYDVNADADMNGVIDTADRLALRDSLGAAVGFTPFDPGDTDIVVGSESLFYASSDSELEVTPTTLIFKSPDGLDASVDRVSRGGEDWRFQFSDYRLGAVNVSLPNLGDINTFRFHMRNAFGQSVQGEFGMYFNVPGINGSAVDLNEFDMYASAWEESPAWQAVEAANGALLDFDLLGAQWQQSGSFEAYLAGLAASGIAVGTDRTVPDIDVIIEDVNEDGLIDQRDIELLGLDG